MDKGLFMQIFLETEESFRVDNGHAFHLTCLHILDFLDLEKFLLNWTKWNGTIKRNIFFYLCIEYVALSFP